MIEAYNHQACTAADRRRHAARIAAALSALLLAASAALAQSAPPPLLPAASVRALAAELSGTAAKHTVQALTLHHRTAATRPPGAR
jgi:hypothetical protein